MTRTMDSPYVEITYVMLRINVPRMEELANFVKASDISESIKSQWLAAIGAALSATPQQPCGNPNTCLSTRTHSEDYMQSAYERGHADALTSVMQLLVQFAQTASAIRRVAMEDLGFAVQKIKPCASMGATGMPTARMFLDELPRWFAEMNATYQFPQVTGIRPIGA